MSTANPVFAFDTMETVTAQKAASTMLIIPSILVLTIKCEKIGLKCNKTTITVILKVTAEHVTSHLELALFDPFACFCNTKEKIIVRTTFPWKQSYIFHAVS